MWLTPIGFGAWAVGGGNWAMSWGPQDDNASIAAIHKAIDLGVNWIDTAAIYGLGHSEEVVGKAVKGSHVKPFIFTKSGMVWSEKGEIKRTLLEIRREVEDSLRQAFRRGHSLRRIKGALEGALRVGGEAIGGRMMH